MEVETVFLRQLRYTHRHFQRWLRKQRTRRRVVGHRRDPLHSIGAEHSQVTNVLLEHREREGVIGVVFETIANLVCTPCLLWNGTNVRWNGQMHLPRAHLGFP